MTYLEKDYLVKPEHSADTLNSGELAVLATPAVVAFAENTCQTLAKGLLTSGQTTVGTYIQITHLKASKIGGSVSVKVQLNEQTNGSLTYEFEVFEKEVCLAKGSHKRAIVDIERFMSRLR